MCKDRKQTDKLLFACNMIMCLENPNESEETLFDE